jgi:hypothetical protein
MSIFYCTLASPSPVSTKLNVKKKSQVKEKSTVKKGKEIRGTVPLNGLFLSNCWMSTPENIDISNIPAINHKYFAYFSKIALSHATGGWRGGGERGGGGG